MAITIGQVKKALEAKDLSYRQLDDRYLLLVVGKIDTRFVIGLEEAGRYLCVQSYGLATVSETHPSFDQILLLLARANENFKLAKFSWNPADGEITVEASLPLEQNTQLTSEQLYRLVSVLPRVCRKIKPDLQQALKAGPPRRNMRTTEVRRKRASPSWALAAGVLLLGIAALIVALRLTC